MSRIDDWNMLCTAYKEADKVEKSTWIVILQKYHSVGNGSGTENPSDEDIALHLNARLTVTAIRERMDAFVNDFLAEP